MHSILEATRRVREHIRGNPRASIRSLLAKEQTHAHASRHQEAKAAGREELLALCRVQIPLCSMQLPNPM